MGTKISWTDETWNPVVGCSKVSTGCDNCYAEKMAHRLSHMGQEKYRRVITDGKGPWNGDTYCDEAVLDKPLHWNNPRKIFVCSMGDLFHETVPFEFIDKVLAAIALYPKHTFQVLTKRPNIMLKYSQAEIDGVDTRTRIAIIAEHESRLRVDGGGREYAYFDMKLLPLTNLWLGITAENQKAADKRTPILLQIPAAVRFVSIEPCLGGVDLGRFVNLPEPNAILDWVVVGCESGSKRRECKLEWVRNIVQQCRAADVPVFVKQLSINGKVNKDMSEWPEDLQIREYPKAGQR